MTGTEKAPAQPHERHMAFPSLAALRAAHMDMLKRHREHATTADFLKEIGVFLVQGRASGALLDDEDERWTAQGILDYWSTTLYRAGYQPPDVTLAEFDPLLAPELPDNACPYVGMDAFHEGHRSQFFGRQRAITSLVEHLASRRLLIVAGSSGSGKSSLVLAGLIADLQQGALLGSENWRYVPHIVPGSSPLINVMWAISRVVLASHETTTDKGTWVHQQAQHCSQDPTHLAHLLGQTATAPLVLVIDQFEELFTLCDDIHTRKAFINNLLSLAVSPKGQHRLIVTIRSDFESYVAQLPRLQSVFEPCTVRVVPFNAAELREAIERPADMVGLKFEAGVVDALIQDILGEPAGLPLLQFTLLKLWQHRERNRVTWRAYQRLGGGRLALARSADAFYERLIPEEQLTVRRILLRMVRPGEGLEITSNRVRRETLYHAGEAHDRVDRVLEKLIHERLIRLTEGETPHDTQVEVAHEALVRNWPLLVEWLEDERETLRQRQRFTSTAEQWDKRGREPGLLLRGSLAFEALRYKDLNKLERDFVRTSLVAISDERRKEELARQERETVRQREIEQRLALAEEQERRALAERQRTEAQRKHMLESIRRTTAERQRALEQQQLAQTQRQHAEEQIQASYRLRTLAIVLAVMVVISIGSATFALYQWQQAQSNAQQLEEANQQLQVNADLLEEVNRARDFTDAQLMLERAIAIADDYQYPQTGDPQLERRLEDFVQEAIRRVRPSFEITPTQTIASVTWHPSGQQAAVLASDGTIFIVNHPDHNKPDPRPIGTHQGVTQDNSAASGNDTRSFHAVWSPGADSRRLLTFRGDATTAYLWDVTGEAAPVRLEGHENGITSATWGHQHTGQYVITTSSDRTARIWDVTTDEAREVAILDAEADNVVSDADWSPAGNFIATASFDSIARIWQWDADTNTATRVANLTAHTSSINDVIWSPDPEMARVLTTGEDGFVRLWDAPSGEEVQNFHHRNEDGSLRRWDPMSGEEVQISTHMSEHEAEDQWAGSKMYAAWSPDGNRVLTYSSSDGDDFRVLVWQVSGSENTLTPVVLEGHGGHITSAEWNRDGRRILTASRDGTARIWDASEGRELFILRGHEHTLHTAAWSPQNTYILTASGNKGHIYRHDDFNAVLQQARRVQETAVAQVVEPTATSIPQQTATPTTSPTTPPPASPTPTPTTSPTASAIPQPLSPEVVTIEPASPTASAAPVAPSPEAVTIEPASPTAPPAVPDEALVNLQAELNELFGSREQQEPGQFGVVVWDITNNVHDYEQMYERNQDVSFYPASLIKLPIAMTVYHMDQQGELSVEERLPLQASDIVAGTGSLGGQPIGSRFTLRELCDYMLRESDNTASNIVLSRISFARVNALMQNLGAENTRVERLFFDTASSGDIRTTPRDMATLLRRLDSGDVTGESGRDALYAAMAQNTDRNKIPALLPPDAFVRNKTGLVSRSEHDAAIIQIPPQTPDGSEGRRYIMVVMSENITNATAINTIAEASQMVYRYQQGR
jgi:beta-lactamase class A/Tol biopolymer transport system component